MDVFRFNTVVLAARIRRLDRGHRRRHEIRRHHKCVIAAILPSIIFGIALFAATTLLSGMPVLGIVAGMGGFVLVVLHVVPMIIGAIIGGIIG